MLSSDKSIIFIINPKAGVKRNVNFTKLIQKIFSVSDYKYELLTTKTPNHATELAVGAVNKNIAFVVAIGGDGTVNEVAKALVNSKTTLGIVPSGSGNGFARHLKIPLKAEQALKLIADRNVLKADTFFVNNFFSVNVSGVGLEAHIAHLFAKAKGRGFWNYARLSLGEFLKYKPFRVRMIIDGIEAEKEIISLSFANSSQYGNNVRIAPRASVVDKQLEVCMMKKFPLIGSIGFGWKMMNGHADNSKYLEVKSGKHVKVFSEVELPLHIDGEPTGFAKEFNVMIIPASLNVAVPKITYT